MLPFANSDRNFYLSQSRFHLVDEPLTFITQRRKKGRRGLPQHRSLANLQPSKPSSALIESLNQQASLKSQSWMRLRGKEQQLKFSSTELRDIKQYFRKLAGDSSFLRTEHLRESLISLGVLERGQDLRRLFKPYPASERLSFDDFITVLNNNGCSPKLQSFLKEIIQGRINQIPFNQHTPFRLLVSGIRRKTFLEAINPRSSQGQRLNALAVMKNCHSEIEELR
jgi:hypothetical protein